MLPSALVGEVWFYSVQLLMQRLMTGQGAEDEVELNSLRTACVSSPPDVWECLSVGAEQNVKAKVGEEGCGMTSSGNIMAVVLQITLQLQVPSKGWYKADASQREIVNGAFAPGDMRHLVFSALTTGKTSICQWIAPHPCSRRLLWLNSKGQKTDK